MLGIPKLILLALVALLMFGPGLFRTIMRAVGGKAGEWHGALREARTEFDKAVQGNREDRC